MSKELSDWRLEKAEETFRDGEELEKLGSYHSAINRYYYAAFHAVRALLAIKGFDSPKHSGVISFFNKEFVKAGLVTKSASKALSDLFRLRSNADYDDFRTFYL
ncbi:HEPN domain-containing protein [Desulfosporosinus hippei]|uniref:HEPN domain-containing protein n=1 Tax=Desulfosporosinus hippei DSM 8344 TaxID=1121419 RepID=A0A1G7SCG5_9FIRM|nr:HEPN domain-containing protein [Desulfosporosinus hippei]SDG20671.1 HEPN domain-containing protein [Desulfosporosinus hippei DSM 8344]